MPLETVLSLASDDGRPSEAPILGLKDGEWAAFLKKLNSGRDRSGEDFVVDGWTISDESPGPQELTRRLAGVGQARRVREVQALLGFRRHNAQADLISADQGPDRRRRPVYPAIELFGEGIFLQFDEGAISEWERRPAVQAAEPALCSRLF